MTAFLLTLDSSGVVRVTERLNRGVRVTESGEEWGRVGKSGEEWGRVGKPEAPGSVGGAQC